MSQGVLLFAFNNKAVNYVEQAEFCCKKIRKHLQLPVTIVTADEVPNKDLFDQIIRIPKGKNRQETFMTENLERLHFGIINLGLPRMNYHLMTRPL